MDSSTVFLKCISWVYVSPVFIKCANIVYFLCTGGSKACLFIAMQGIQSPLPCLDGPNKMHNTPRHINEKNYLSVLESRLTQ